MTGSPSDAVMGPSASLAPATGGSRASVSAGAVPRGRRSGRTLGRDPRQDSAAITTPGPAEADGDDVSGGTYGIAQHLDRAQRVALEAHGDPRSEERRVGK